MKRVVMSLAVILICSAASVFGQNLSLSRIGDVIRQDSSRQYISPSTTIVIDVLASRETIKTGPYARFAQKYFGVIAPLADKDVYSLISATVSYYDTDIKRNLNPSLLAEPTSSMMSHIDGGEEFTRVLPDKLTTTTKSPEEAAADAANKIFSLRKRRTELITGEYAETVFGAGLKAAIERIDKMENQYLELFFGKQTITKYTVRYSITPSEGKNTFVVGRFKEDAGLLPVGDLSAEPIVIECRPFGVAAAAYPAPEKRLKDGVRYRVADMVNCRVIFGKQELGGAELPIYQYGVTVLLPSANK